MKFLVLMVSLTTPTLPPCQKSLAWDRARLRLGNEALERRDIAIFLPFDAIKQYIYVY